MAVRSLFTTKGVLRSKVVTGKEAEGAKFKDYFDWEEPAAKAPSHRILAIRRGETEGMLTSRLMPPEDEAIVLLNGMFVKNASPAAEQVRLAIEDGYRRLLEPSIETEARLEAKQRADAEAIRVFAANLRELLLASPLGGKTVLGIDPGFRTGCKVVCLDRQGKLLHHDVIFIEQSDRQRDVARQTVLALCSRFQIDAVAIGNGTASRETEAFVRALDLPPAISVVMVNESGASFTPPPRPRARVPGSGHHRARRGVHRPPPDGSAGGAGEDRSEDPSAWASTSMMWTRQPSSAASMTWS